MKYKRNSGRKKTENCLQNFTLPLRLKKTKDSLRNFTGLKLKNRLVIDF
jgi:hypothetical protein